MKKLSDLMTITNNQMESHEIKSMSINSLSRFAMETLGDKTISTSIIIESSFDKAKDKLISIQQNLKTETPKFNAQLTKPLYEDENLLDFIFVLDCISAFDKITDIYFQNEKNEKNWYANEIKKHLLSIDEFVNQLGRCITPHADDIDIQLDLDMEIFDGKKELATIIKTNDEYKKFKKVVRKRMDFSNQPLNVRALAHIILGKCKELVRII